MYCTVDSCIYMYIYTILYIHVLYSTSVYEPSLNQGFREKNRDLMRQDIIDVLRTSHMDLVRALIGLPPYAVHRWHMAFLKVTTTFAFKSVTQYHHRLYRRVTVTRLYYLWYHHLLIIFFTSSQSVNITIFKEYFHAKSL